MSSGKTTNLNLHAWEPEDRFMREEFNENFAAIDANAGNTRKELEAQIAAAAATAASAAEEAKNAANTAQSAANAAASAASGAQSTAESALQAASSAQSTASSAQQTASSAQNTASAAPRLALGSYSGTGEIFMDASSAKTIELGFEAKVVWLATDGDSSSMDQSEYFGVIGSGMQPWFMLTRDISSVSVYSKDTSGYGYKHSIHFIWSGTTLKFYATLNPISTAFLDAGSCLNKSGRVYRWVAIG